MPRTVDLSLPRRNEFVSASATEAVLPSAYANVMGEANNSFPHSVRNLRYQQVFQGSDVVNSTLIGMCLRRDDLFGGVERIQTIAVKLGPTSLDYTTLGSYFASNYSAPPTAVFSGDIVIPAAAPGGTPSDWDLCIPFSQPYSHPAGSNLIVEVVNTSSVSGNVPRDACDGAAAACTTARAFAFSATAEDAILVMPGGLVMKFLSPEPPKPLDPETMDECTKGGWIDFGFRNQGQCVRFIETGKDSRTGEA
jgi:hypothetical protein